MIFLFESTRRTMTPKELARELIRTRADVDQTRAGLDELNGRLDELHRQISRLLTALDLRRRRDAVWQKIHLLMSTLIFGIGTALLILTLHK